MRFVPIMSISSKNRTTSDFALGINPVRKIKKRVDDRNSTSGLKKNYNGVKKICKIIFGEPQ